MNFSKNNELVSNIFGPRIALLTSLVTAVNLTLKQEPEDFDEKGRFRKRFKEQCFKIFNHFLEDEVLIALKMNIALYHYRIRTDAVEMNSGAKPMTLQEVYDHINDDLEYVDDCKYSFRFAREVKCVIWEREFYEVEANSQSEALEKLLSGSEDMTSSEMIYETQEDMSVENNNGEPTIEIFSHGSDKVQLYNNKTGVTDGIV